MIYQILHWVCRGLMAGIFLYTGYIKLESPLQFAAVLYGYKLFPDSIIMPMSTYFPWLEMVLGVLFIIGWKMRYVALAACGLIGMFIVVLTITYLRGIDANCGCFSFDDRITPLTIVRDGIIIVPAIYLALESWLRARRHSAAAPVAVE
jgi:putative oxidoreductase